MTLGSSTTGPKPPPAGARSTGTPAGRLRGLLEPDDPRPAPAPRTGTPPTEATPATDVPDRTTTVPTGAKAVPAKNGPAKNGPAKNGPAKNGPAKAVPAKNGPAKTVPAKTVPAKTVPAKTVPAKTVRPGTAPPKAKTAAPKAAPSKSRTVPPKTVRAANVPSKAKDIPSKAKDVPAKAKDVPAAAVPLRLVPPVPAAGKAPAPQPSEVRPTPPTEPATPSRGTAGRGVLVVLLVAALVAVAAWWATDRDQTSPVASPVTSPGPSASLPATPTAPAGEEPTAPVLGPGLVTVPGTLLPSGLPIDGLGTTAAVVGSDTIEVVERVRWPDGGPATIALLLPADAAQQANLTTVISPVVESLQVSVDGVAMTPEPVAGTEGSWVVVPPSGSAPREMEVRYLLRDAFERSLPASPGRALAVIAPLAASAVGDLPVEIVLVGQDVLNVYCPQTADRATILCGRQDGDRWVAVPPPGPALVVAQVDLPAPA